MAIVEAGSSAIPETIHGRKRSLRTAKLNVIVRKCISNYSSISTRIGAGA